MAKILLTHQWKESWNLALSLWKAEISFNLLYESFFWVNSETSSCPLSNRHTDGMMEKMSSKDDRETNYTDDNIGN